MKEFTILLLGVIFLALIAGSVQSIYADHILEDGKGIFKDEFYQNFAKTTNSNSKYQIHLQVEIRNVQGQLISIAETSHGNYIPEGISDLMFEKLGKKEIVTIDNIKYEKVQYTYTPTLEHRFMGLYPIFSENYNLEFESTPEAREKMHEHKDFAMWKIHYCGTFEGHGFQCIPVFQDLVPTMTLEPHDVVTHQWTILRILN